MTNEALALRILIVAPVGRDAAAIVELLESRGHLAQVCGGLRDAGAQVENGAGAMLLTEESLEREQITALLPKLDQQPAWSELPVIILMTAGERSGDGLDRIAAAAGGITLLERPIGAATLLRSIEVALNSRRRQYQVRDLLEAQRHARPRCARARSGCGSPSPRSGTRNSARTPLSPRFLTSSAIRSRRSASRGGPRLAATHVQAAAMDSECDPAPGDAHGLAPGRSSRADTHHAGQVAAAETALLDTQT